MARPIIFGEIPGIEEGKLFLGRKEMMPSSFHRVWGRGIDSDKNKGAAAIVLSGGANDFADLKKVYIIHANGLISRANKNIFSTNRSFALSPGDTIIVPRKIIIEGQILKNITAFSQVISNIAFSAAALQSLNTNNN